MENATKMDQTLHSGRKRSAPQASGSSFASAIVKNVAECFPDLIFQMCLFDFILPAKIYASMIYI